MQELEGKVAIITGAGRMRSIGRATARVLARAGCDVVVTGTGRDPATYPEEEQQAGWQDVHSVAEEIRALGKHALPLVVDVSNAQQVEEMAQRTLRELGRVDILVNNAAFARGPDRLPVVELDEALFRRVWEVKVLGAFLCSRAVARQLIPQGQGGHIINVSSTAGRRGQASFAAYCAANFALHGLTQVLALELAPYEIRVNAVCPGLIDTQRNDLLGRGELWQQRVSQIPLLRAGAAEEVAEVIRFLCSPASSYITGQFINVNGGTVMH